MPRIASFELWSVDLPLRPTSKRATAGPARSSDSLFLRCTLDNTAFGFGESLPRLHLSGESRDTAFDLLAQHILPRLVGLGLDDMPSLLHFLKQCDGKAPADWVAPSIPQTAAWSAVDLALLDSFARAWRKPVELVVGATFPPKVRYSPVLSYSAGTAALLLVRLGRYPQVKLEVQNHPDRCVSRARRILGRNCDIRVDANNAWNADEAFANIQTLHHLGVHSIERPLPPSETASMARLVATTDAQVMMDEGFTDGPSLGNLISNRACNVTRHVGASRFVPFATIPDGCRHRRVVGSLACISSATGRRGLLDPS